MTYNEALAEREHYSETFTEKKMFGERSFLYPRKMTIGSFAVRVSASKMPLELEQPEVRPMDFTKHPIKEFIYVPASGFTTKSQLLYYIELGLEHAKSKL